MPHFEHLKQLAHQADAVRIVLGQVFTQAGTMGMHLRAAQFLVGRDLPRRGLQQRRSGEEGGCATVRTMIHVIRQAGNVSPARGR